VKIRERKGEGVITGILEFILFDPACFIQYYLKRKKKIPIIIYGC
jgi:hypothetical protein